MKSNEDAPEAGVAIVFLILHGAGDVVAREVVENLLSVNVNLGGDDSIDCINSEVVLTRSRGVDKPATESDESARIMYTISSVLHD